MGRRRKSSSRIKTSNDRRISTGPAVQLEPGKLFLPYPLRNRLQQHPQYGGKHPPSEDAEPQKSPDRATTSNITPKSLRSGANSEYQLRHLSCRDSQEGGTFALTDLLENNLVVRSSMAFPQVGNECSIHSLPTEILTMIFSYLTVKELSLIAAPVCRYWYMLAHSPVLWKSLTFNQSDSLSEVKRLLRKSYLLSSLCIKDRCDVGKIISQICKSNNNIRSLAIHRVGGTKTLSYSWKTLKANHLQQLLKRCSRITKLILKDLTIRSRKFYQNLGSSLPNLTHLCLSYSHLLNPSNISDVADSCCCLKLLWLIGDCQSGQSLDWEEAFQKLFRNLSGTLTHLQFDASKLSDPAFEDLSRCQELQVLSLHKAAHISTTAMNSIGSLKKLLYLNIHKSQYVCEIEHPYPFESATFNLVYLSLSECTFVNDGFAEVVGKYCPQLLGIGLAFSHQVSDRGVLFIIQGCQRLKSLDIYFTGAVRGYCFTMFPRYAPQLQLVILEQFCDLEKEYHIKWLIDSLPQVHVDRPSRWLANRIDAVRT